MGRPRKGDDRVSIAAKPERPLAEVIQRNAVLLGMSYGDYMVAIAAIAHGMPQYAPKPTRTASLDALLSPHPGETAAVEAILDRVRGLLLERVAAGRPISELGSADEVAATIMMRLQASSPWPAVIGPCFTGEAMQRELGINPQALCKAVDELRVLRLETADGTDLYPAFQLVDRRLVAGLDQVLRALRDGVDSAMMWAQWLNKPAARPDGEARRRIDELAAGHIDGVVREAQHTAAAWAE